ncbi:MAG: MerR family DNA-binding protein, partial [Ramlibacter sp.]
ALRRPSGHRVYNAHAQELLKLIRHCREFGFSIDETRELTSLAANDGKDCADARAIAQQHLNAVRTKLAELRALEISLAGFVQACSEQCIGGPAPQCTILKDLNRGGPAAVPLVRCCG